MLVLAIAQARAAAPLCPIDAVSFDTMNMFCGGRGTVATVGEIKYLTNPRPDGTEWLPASEGFERVKGGATTSFTALPRRSVLLLLDSVTNPSPQCGFPWGACPREPVDSAEDLNWIERWLGVIVDERGKRRGVVSGEFDDGEVKEPVSVAGCAMCHTGRVAGRVYRGLGNKLIDVWQANRLLRRGNRALHPFAAPGPFLVHETSTAPATTRSLVLHMKRFAKRAAYEPWASRTRGLVPDALVLWWFFAWSGDKLPDTAPRGEVKVPALWGFANRRGNCLPELGQCSTPLFADGFAHGRSLLAGAELGADPTPATIALPAYQARMDALATLIEEELAGGPPPFPCGVDANLVQAGADVYAAECERCHGTPGDGAPPELKPIRVVATDPERLKLAAASTGFGGAEPACEPTALCARTRAAVDAIASPANRLHRARWQDEGGQTTGYFAPRLEGIWARFPYLHNGSVPTVDALLGPPADRPEAFDLTEASTVAGFDPRALGLAVSPGGATCPKRALEDPEWFGGSRLLYCAARTGHGNGGHAFWGDDGLPKRERTAVIEYLKTLGGGVRSPPEGWCTSK